MTRRILFPLVFVPALFLAGCAERDENADQAAAPPAAVPAEEGDMGEGKRAAERGIADSEDMPAPEAAATASPDATSAPMASPRRGRPVGKAPAGLDDVGGRQKPPSKPRPSFFKGDRFSWGATASKETAKPSASTATGDSLREKKDKQPEPSDDSGILAQKGGRDMMFRHYGVNPTIDTAEQAKSTFAIDVDTASYTMTRSFLERGQLPVEAAVRVEEVVNAFDYGYQAPRSDTFSIQAEAAPSPNRHGYHVLHVGIKGKEIAKAQRKPADLTFVVDVSGSMDAPNRIGLVKQSLRLLVGQLGEADTIGIVTYGSNAREVLQPTSVYNKQRILGVIDGLRIEGATNAEAGLRLGYQVAQRHLRPGHVNRVILCSDGVANVGLTGPSGLLDTIQHQTKKGITLSTVGFGMGTYNDVLMEKLADGGDGNYHYVDKLDEARRVFVEQLTGTLEVIAKDVKIQVDFDPSVVTRYRLLGYENRGLQAQQFDDDRVDAGEVGAGHSVTAIYEVKLRDDSTAPLGKIRVRYKNPEGGASKLVEQRLVRTIVRDSASQLSSPTQLSLVAAQFAEKLRGSYWARNVNYDDIKGRLAMIKAPLRNSAQVAELERLIAKAAQLDKRTDKFAAEHGPVAMMDFDRVPVLR